MVSEKAIKRLELMSSIIIALDTVRMICKETDDEKKVFEFQEFLKKQMRELIPEEKYTPIESNII